MFDDFDFESANALLKAQRREEKFRRMQEEQKNPPKHRRSKHRKVSKKQETQRHLDSLRDENGNIPRYKPVEPPKKKSAPAPKPTLQDFVAFKKRSGENGVKVAELPWETRKRTWKEKRKSQRRHWDSMWRGKKVGYSVPRYVPSEYVGLYKSVLIDRFNRMRRRQNFGVPERTLDALDLKFH